MYLVNNQIFRIFILLLVYINFNNGRINAQKAQSIDSLSLVRIPEKCSSVWGMTHSSGLELALLGTRTGLGIYDLSNPSVPLQIKFIPGHECLWRELKTYQDFVYVVTECKDSLLIVDLRDLSSIQFHLMADFKNKNGDEAKIESAHTLFIDEKSYLYLAGSPSNAGFMIFDLKNDPYNPEYIFGYGDEYYHEVYVSKDTLFGASIYDGEFVIWDIKNRENPIRVANQQTAFRFTHSVWKEDQRPILYTADETSSAVIEAWDISNLNRIKLLDNFRPNYPNEKLSIPHNCFYKEGYLFVSWYTEGVRVIDVRKPDNLVEVAYYDTYPGPEQGFHGCWNVFPYFASGIILASDIENGMYILKFKENRAAYLEGLVTDKSDGTQIQNATIDIVGMNVSSQASSDIKGQFRTGYSSTEKVLVKVSKPGYKTILDSISLISDQTIVRNYELESLPKYSIKIQAIHKHKPPIQLEDDVKVRIWNNEFSYEALSDSFGFIVLENVIEGDYLFQTAKWGRLHYSIPQYRNRSDSILVVELEDGYEDQFNINQQWKTIPDTQKLQWHLSNFNELFPKPSNYPSSDVSFDLGNNAIYTRNFDDSDFNINVVGHSYLISPEMDLSPFDKVTIDYTAWAYGGWDSSIKETYIELNDKLIPLETIPENLNGSFNPSSTFTLDLRAEERTQCNFVFHLWNDPDSVRYAISMKAALDGFKIIGSRILDNESVFNKFVKCFPNPFFNSCVVDNQSDEVIHIEVFSILGKLILSKKVNARSKDLIELGAYSNQIYILKYTSVLGNISGTYKLIKN